MTGFDYASLLDKSIPLSEEVCASLESWVYLPRSGGVLPRWTEVACESLLERTVSLRKEVSVPLGGQIYLL